MATKTKAKTADITPLSETKITGRSINRLERGADIQRQVAARAKLAGYPKEAARILKACDDITAAAQEILAGIKAADPEAAARYTYGSKKKAA